MATKSKKVLVVNVKRKPSKKIVRKKNPVSKTVAKKCDENHFKYFVELFGKDKWQLVAGFRDNVLAGDYAKALAHRYMRQARVIK